MAKLIIDLTGKKGLAKGFYGDVNKSSSSPNLRYDAEDGDMVDGYFNPKRVRGYIAPANYSYKQITAGGTSTTYGAVVRAFIDDLATSSAVWAAVNTRFRKSGTNNPGDGNDSFSTLDSTATSVSDVTDAEIYQVNSVRKAFIAATDRISIYDTATTLYDTAWSTTTASGAVTPTASDYSRLVKSDNGYMYWLIGNLVYKIDGGASGGTNGTISLALTFPTNLYLYDGLSARGKLFIAINPDTATSIRNNAVFEHKAPMEVGVYVWDRSSAVTSLSDFYPLPGVAQIRKIYIAPNGDIRVIAIGTNRLTVMFRFTGSEFERIHDLPPSAYPNQPKGLATGNGVSYWLGQDGILYANYFPIGDKDYVVKLLNCNNVSTTIAGASRTVARAGAILLTGRYDNNNLGATGFKQDYEALILSWRDSNGDDRVIRYLPHSTTAFDSVTPKASLGNAYSPVKLLPTLSNLVHAEIYCVPIENTGSDVIATVHFYANNSTTAFKSHQVTKDQAKRGYVSIPLNKQYVNNVQMQIEWNTTQQLGADDFCPSICQLEYVPSATPARTKSN